MLELACFVKNLSGQLQARIDFRRPVCVQIRNYDSWFHVYKSASCHLSRLTYSVYKDSRFYVSAVNQLEFWT